jgi:hypothetical protein
VRISQNVKKNLLKDNNGNYQKEELVVNETQDVSLVNRDQEVNFGNKADEDDDIDMKG